jgi:acetyl-CoA acetyltransferase
MREAVSIVATRTAIGAFHGSLAPVPATELGAIVIGSLLEGSGLKVDLIDEGRIAFDDVIEDSQQRLRLGIEGTADEYIRYHRRFRTSPSSTASA